MLLTMLPNPKATFETLVTHLQCVALQAKDVLEAVGPSGFAKSKLFL